MVPKLSFRIAIRRAYYYYSIPCYINRQLSHLSHIKPPKQLLITTSRVFLEILRSRHKISPFPPTTLTWTFNKRWYLQAYKTPKDVHTILWCVSDHQSLLYQYNSLFWRFPFCIQWHCVNFHRFHIHHNKRRSPFVTAMNYVLCLAADGWTAVSLNWLSVLKKLIILTQHF
jgi:hypothetical protein